MHLVCWPWDGIHRYCQDTAAYGTGETLAIRLSPPQMSVFLVFFRRLNHLPIIRAAFFQEGLMIFVYFF